MHRTRQPSHTSSRKPRSPHASQPLMPPVPRTVRHAGYQHDSAVGLRPLFRLCLHRLSCLPRFLTESWSFDVRSRFSDCVGVAGKSSSHFGIQKCHGYTGAGGGAARGGGLLRLVQCAVTCRLVVQVQVSQMALQLPQMHQIHELSSCCMETA